MGGSASSYLVTQSPAKVLYSLVVFHKHRNLVSSLYLLISIVDSDCTSFPRLYLLSEVEMMNGRVVNFDFLNVSITEVPGLLYKDGKTIPSEE